MSKKTDGTFIVKNKTIRDRKLLLHSIKEISLNKSKAENITIDKSGIKGVYCKRSEIKNLTIKSSLIDLAETHLFSRIKKAYFYSTGLGKDGIKCSTTILEDSVVARCTINGGKFIRCIFSGTAFIDTTFENCVFSNTPFKNCSFSGCVFRNCIFKNYSGAKRTPFYKCNFYTATALGVMSIKYRMFPECFNIPPKQNKMIKCSGTLLLEGCSGVPAGLLKSGCDAGCIIIPTSCCSEDTHTEKTFVHNKNKAYRFFTDGI